MSEHITSQQIERFHKLLMSPVELLSLDDHMASCEVCRSRVSEAARVGASFESMRADFDSAAAAEPTHVTYEQMVSYVDGRAGEVDREIIEGHAAYCDGCSAELRDLAEFSARMNSHPAAEPARAPTFWERVKGYWALASFRLPLQVAGAAAAVALIVWVATLSLRTEIADLEARLASVSQENERLQKEYEVARAETEELQAQLAGLQPSTTGGVGPDPSDSVIVALNDGGRRVTLDREGEVGGLDSLAPSRRQMVKAALTSQKAESPALISELAGRAGVLMGGASEGIAFNLVGPIGTVVATARPTFRWNPLKGAESYLVAVYDANFNWVATSQPLATTSWTVPKALERGNIYTWQVSAVVGGKEIKSPSPPAPEARFKVLEAVKAAELAREIKKHRNSPLISGLLYAQAGLLDDAEGELQRLVRANPRSDVARKLLGSVRALRGR